jgi:hypothetical protein
MINQAYFDFLASKAMRAKVRGLDTVPVLAGHLFPFQRLCVDFNLRVGCAGLFLDTGLGKTECQLEWASQALRAHGKRALILTPLAVAGQTKRRADRWGYEAKIIREQHEAITGINICNYDRIDKLEPSEFDVVSLDEASILKSFTGKTTRALIEAFKGCRFKLAATATPAPNDHMELGNYAEFLEIMAANEMLSRFFINDTSTASQEWRLKGHAVTAFWDWMSSFSRMGERPSDITGNTKEDAAFALPPMETHRHRTQDNNHDSVLSELFGRQTLSATNIFDVKRQTSAARAEVVGRIVSEQPNEPWLIWCDTNDEADALLRAIPNSKDVRGSMSIDRKEELLAAFESGELKHLVAKPSMCGFGLDWSHCANMAFVGRTYSYETWYQAVRRCWRFGQTRTVNVHLVVAEGETQIGRVIDRKSGDHATMKLAMRDAMRRNSNVATVRKVAYTPTADLELPPWLTGKSIPSYAQSAERHSCADTSAQKTESA